METVQRLDSYASLAAVSCVNRTFRSLAAGTSQILGLHGMLFDHHRTLMLWSGCHQDSWRAERKQWPRPGVLGRMGKLMIAYMEQSEVKGYTSDIQGWSVQDLAKSPAARHTIPAPSSALLSAPDSMPEYLALKIT